MREVKFRIYDRLEQRYLTTNELYSYNISPIDGHVLFIDGHDVDARYIKQQYIGLKDKTGKEICEGDIISHLYLDRPDELDRELEIVRYDNVRAMFTGCHAYSPIKTGTCSVLDHTHEILLFDKIKVIGNIYENPELLEAK